MAAKVKNMVCFDCGMKIKATIIQARSHGWTLWVGGARCKRCTEKDAVPDSQKPTSSP